MAAPLPLFKVVNHGPQPNQAAAEKKEGRVESARTTPGACDQAVSRGVSHATESRIDAVTPGDTTQRQNSLPLFSDAIQVAIQSAIAIEDWDSAAALVEVARRHSANLAEPETGIVSVAAFRERREERK
jgi:hypothetical protein